MAIDFNMDPPEIWFCSKYTPFPTAGIKIWYLASAETGYNEIQERGTADPEFLTCRHRMGRKA